MNPKNNIHLFHRILLGMAGLAFLTAISIFCYYLKSTHQDAIEEEKTRTAELNALFLGERPLRKMLTSQNIEGRFNGGYFLFGDAIAGEVGVQQSVSFAWQSKNETWQISRLPLERLRVRFNENASSPVIRFTVDHCGASLVDIRCYPMQQLINECVTDAVITVREQDWPINISLPLSKG